MRLIGELHERESMLTFAHFLDKKGIAYQIETETNQDWGSPNYGDISYKLWIFEEDQADTATEGLHLFMKNPTDDQFHLPASPSLDQPEHHRNFEKEEAISASTHPSKESSPLPTEGGWEKEPMGILTRLLLITCCVLFLMIQLHLFSEASKDERPQIGLFSSPIEKALLYDYPQTYELLSQFLEKYPYTALKNPAELPPEGQALIQRLNKTPSWPGIYPLLIKGGFSEALKGFRIYPTFEKIRQGEYWRLFTPCLLHEDLLHLFFNMLWLIVLGKQIEQRLTTWRYGLCVLMLGIFSNTAQYLTSGPNFIGISGVVCGMLGFIWMRQKVAAWEGYQMDRLTILFMLVFILGMASLQLFSFFIEKTFEWNFSPNIANMAHLSGGILGLLLGRIDFFRWRET